MATKNVGILVKNTVSIRMTEMGAQYGESILDVMHEQLFDGIMSAIDCKLTEEKIEGDKGGDRTPMTRSGKFPIAYRTNRPGMKGVVLQKWPILRGPSQRG